MKGAVLISAGVEGAQNRWMRRSYGILVGEIFKPGVHPEHREYTSLDGLARCDVMHWYTTAVTKR
jgi:hypothetical protein